MWRVRLILLAFLVCLVLAIRYLPGWAWLVIAGVALLLPFVVRLIIRRKLRSFVKELDAETPPGMPAGIAALFKMKGSVLRKARLTVHSIQPVEAPLPPIETEDDDEAHPPLPCAGQIALPPPQDPGAEHVGEENQVIGTDSVTPARDYFLLDVTIKPTRWGIGFKRWQPGELALTSPGSGWLDNDDSCEILNVQVANHGDFGPEDDMRYAGAQRLRLLVGVRQGVERLTFRYYTERFGDILLRAPGQLPPNSGVN